MSGDIPQWAVERADKLYCEDTRNGVTFRETFARYIAAHEQPPVDPLRAEAIALVLAEAVTRTDNQIHAIKAGLAGEGKIELALAALKRGIELAKEPS